MAAARAGSMMTVLVEVAVRPSVSVWRRSRWWRTGSCLSVRLDRGFGAGTHGRIVRPRDAILRRRRCGAVVHRSVAPCAHSTVRQPSVVNYRAANRFVSMLMEEDMKKKRTGKERIIPPSKRETHAGSSSLRQGSPAGGRVLADQSVAKRQGGEAEARSVAD